MGCQYISTRDGQFKPEDGFESGVAYDNNGILKSSLKMDKRKGKTKADLFDKMTLDSEYDIDTHMSTDSGKNKLSKRAAATNFPGLPQVGCMPGCLHLHRHNFEFDFTKSYLDPIQDRPAYFKEFNEEFEAIKCEVKKGNSPRVAKF